MGLKFDEKCTYINMKATLTSDWVKLSVILLAMTMSVLAETDEDTCPSLPVGYPYGYQGECTAPSFHYDGEVVFGLIGKCLSHIL